MTFGAPGPAFAARGDAERLRTTIVALIFAVALLPLFATPVLPFIDLYNHLARYYVLANLATDPLLQANYAAQWAILPNVGLDVVGTALLHVLPPRYAAHVTVVAIFIVQFAGVMYFNRALTGRWSPFVALLLVPLLYSYILNWGFANFLCGLGLAFAAAGWWIAQRARPWLAVPVACVLAVMIFFTHGVDFALYGILVGALEVGFFIDAPRRDWAGLARRLGLVAIQAIIPIWLFTLAPTTKAAGGLTNADEAVARLRAAGDLGERLWQLVVHRVETIVRVAEGPSYAFDAIVAVALVALLALLFRRGALRLDRRVWPVLAAGALLVACTPPALFGVGYVADRMPLFFAFALVGGMVVTIDRDRDRVVVAGLAGLIALRLAAIAVDWTDYARDYRDFSSVASRLPPGALVSDVITGGNHHDNSTRRCHMYRPLLVSQFGAVAPLFAAATAQPLRLIGPLQAATSRMPPFPRTDNLPYGFFDDIAAAAGPAGYTHLMICDPGALTRPFPAGSTVVAQASRFTLLAFPRARGEQ